MLTERQKKILDLIIEEYIDSNREIGSSHLSSTLDSVSPATIRNDMMKLGELGYLKKTHSSSGRLPTDIALRIYYNKLKNKQKLNDRIVDAITELKNSDDDFEVMLEKIVTLLAKESRTASFVSSNEHTIYRGVSYLVEYDEFADVQNIHRVLSFLDDIQSIQHLFVEYQENEVVLLIGEEIGLDYMDSFTISYTYGHCYNHKLLLGVIGTKRLDYPYIYNVIKAIKDNLKS